MCLLRRLPRGILARARPETVAVDGAPHPAGRLRVRRPIPRTPRRPPRARSPSPAGAPPASSRSSPSSPASCCSSSTPCGAAWSTASSTGSRRQPRTRDRQPTQDAPAGRARRRRPATPLAHRSASLGAVLLVVGLALGSDRRHRAPGGPATRPRGGPGLAPGRTAPSVGRLPEGDPTARDGRALTAREPEHPTTGSAPARRTMAPMPDPRPVLSPPSRLPRAPHFAVASPRVDDDGTPRQAVVWYRLRADDRILLNSRTPRALVRQPLERTGASPLSRSSTAPTATAGSA